MIRIVAFPCAHPIQEAIRIQCLVLILRAYLRRDFKQLLFVPGK